MESFLDLLELLVRPIITVVVIVLFFMYIVRPLLNYLVVNHEIELHKRYGNGGSFANPAPDLMESYHDEMTVEDTGHSAKRSPKDGLDRLAAGDPDKAGNLVKKWINEN